MSLDRAVERFGLLAASYRSSGEALNVVARWGSSVSDDILEAANKLALAAPLNERSGVLYGHIRMAEQGWERAADFKLTGNHGLDAAYTRMVGGAREYAVLEAKSGRAAAGALGEAGRAQQGTSTYIENRLTAFLSQAHLPQGSKDLAGQFLAASQSGSLQSFLSFADAGGAGARLLKLPGTPISALSNASLVSWRNLPGGI